MGSRSEGVEVPEKTAWHGTERAQAYLAVRRARGVSTRRLFGQIGGRSSEFMDTPGYGLPAHRLTRIPAARSASIALVCRPSQSARTASLCSPWRGEARAPLVASEKRYGDCTTGRVPPPPSSTCVIVRRCRTVGNASVRRAFAHIAPRKIHLVERRDHRRAIGEVFEKRARGRAAQFDFLVERRIGRRRIDDESAPGELFEDVAKIARDQQRARRGVPDLARHRFQMQRVVVRVVQMIVGGEHRIDHRDVDVLSARRCCCASAAPTADRQGHATPRSYRRSIPRCRRAASR